MTTTQIWSLLLHAHDHCRHSDGRIILHRLMVEVIEDQWRRDAAAKLHESIN